MDWRRVNSLSRIIRCALASGAEIAASFKDLWKYHKVKSGEVISDVLLREYVVDLSLALVYGTEDNAMAQRIARGFNDPVYALTAGHSDSLLVLCSVELMETDWEPLESVYFCAVPHDMTGAYQADKSVLDLPLTESIRAPQVFNLPVRFNFEGERRTIAGAGIFHLYRPSDTSQRAYRGLSFKIPNPRPRLRPNYSGAAMIFLAKCNPNETYEEHVWSVYLAWKQLIDKHSGAIKRLCDRHSVNRDRFLLSSLLLCSFSRYGQAIGKFPAHHVRRV